MGQRFTNWQKPKIEDSQPTRWHWIVRHPDKLLLGTNTDIGAFTYIQAEAGVEIQDEVEIGSHCSIYSVSTIDRKRGKVTIKKGAKVGTHSTIMPGVVIGEGAMVAAHSFVNKKVPKGALVGGVPAKSLKKS